MLKSLNICGFHIYRKNTDIAIIGIQFDRIHSQRDELYQESIIIIFFFLKKHKIAR